MRSLLKNKHIVIVFIKMVSGVAKGGGVECSNPPLGFKKKYYYNVYGFIVVLTVILMYL